MANGSHKIAVKDAREIMGMIKSSKDCRGACKRHLKYAEKHLRGMTWCKTDTCRLDRLNMAYFALGTADAFGLFLSRGRKRKR